MCALKLIAALCLFSLILAPSVHAQNLNGESQTLSEINKVHPLQNPQYEKSSDTLDRHILDNKNKVVAQLQDVVVGRTGAVHTLRVSFDRLNLDAPVYLNYSALRIHPYSKAYVLGFNDEQIAGLYPSLLAQVETAAGGNEDDLSVRRMLTAQVVAQDGRGLGAISDVLFNADGEHVNALYVDVKSGVLNGQSLAIPFSAASFSDTDGKPTVTVSNAMANAMLDYASKQ